MSNYDQYPEPFCALDIEECISGDFKITKEVQKTLSGDVHYTMLSCGENSIMTDLPSEAWLHLEFYNQAQGDILISGLGLGFILEFLLQKDGVNSITVVEKEQDVINMVAGRFPTVRIIHADIYAWEQDREYDVIWHDIYPMSRENVDQLNDLEKKFSAKKWQGYFNKEWINADAPRGV